MLKRTIGYLSAALRVSRHPEAQASGPRAHILGVISGFEQLGWSVKPFIVGDQMPKKLLRKTSKQAIGRSFLRILAADIIRLVLGCINALRVWYKLGNKVEMVYERFAVLQSLGWIFKKNGIPWILETNGPFFYEAKVERKSLILVRLAHFLEIKAYQNCSVLVCVSETLKEIILQEAGVSPNKIVVIPNAVDTTFFSPNNYEHKRISNGLTIGYIGGLPGWQGLDLLIEAIHELKLDGYELFLIIVGDGANRETLEGKVERLNLTSTVKFVGQVFRAQVPDYIAGFDIGYSGQTRLELGEMYHSPLKLYEYMAMAKPVIASNFEDARRLVEEGKNGYLFEADCKKSLIGKLHKACDNRENLAKMGLYARKKIISCHRWTDRVSLLLRYVDVIVET
jgi:glycosyltransferase involved in cell wall biosynthesis